LKNILLIRKNEFDHLYWKELLNSMDVFLVDVHQPFHIDIINLGTKGSPEAEFLGRKLDYFDKIIFLGTPAWPENNDESVFAFSELEATLISLFKISRAPVVNAGLSLSANKLLQAPIAFCKFWEKSGWVVPEIRYSYSKGQLTKTLGPDPQKHTHYLLHLSVNDYLLWPNYRVIFNDHAKFKAILEATQMEMAHRNFDFLILQFFESAGVFYLFGYVTELVEIRNNRLLRFMESVIA